jgi:hypothetical protein
MLPVVLREFGNVPLDVVDVVAAGEDGPAEGYEDREVFEGDHLFLLNIATL